MKGELSQYFSSPAWSTHYHQQHTAHTWSSADLEERLESKPLTRTLDAFEPSGWIIFFLLPVLSCKEGILVCSSLRRLEQKIFICLSVLRKQSLKSVLEHRHYHWFHFSAQKHCNFMKIGIAILLDASWRYKLYISDQNAVFY